MNGAAAAPAIDGRYRGEGDYLAQTGDWHEGDAIWKAGHIARILPALGIRPASIADVGCGTGGVLDHLSRALPGVPAIGYEIAPEAAQRAMYRARGGLGFRQASLFDTQDHFDLLISCDVFEHVPDYLGFLRNMRAHAGRFVFHIPLDISARTLLTGWPEEARRTVGHLHFFTEATALGTLREAGYDVVAHELHHAIMQPPPRDLRTQFRRLPHRALFAADRSLCAKLLGGCSMTVAAR